ncbi:MAG: transporter [Paenibacillaceae bacterium]|jgi:predicted MFS family arabinose efflux permease|nr:transporter [Paenibacillaceae bacterium]
MTSIATNNPAESVGTAVQPSRRRVILFSIVTILFWISMYTYVPVLSPYLEDRGYSFSMIGIILGSYGFMQIVIRLPLGIWSDRMGIRKPFLFLGFAATILSCLLFLIPGHWIWPLVGRATAGISASTWVGFTVLFAGYYAKEEATRAMGTISFLTIVGQLIGMALSGWMAEGFGWSSVFLAGAVAGGVGLVLTSAVFEPKAELGRAPMQAKDLAAVVKNPLLLKVSVLSILAHSILFITMFGFTPSKALDLGALKSDLTLLSVFFMVPHAVTAILSGKKLAPRFGPWNTALAGFALSAACTLSIPFLHSFAALCATQAINGFAQGLHMPLLLGLAIQEIEPAKRATAMGFYQAVYALGMFCGPFLAGWLNEGYGLSAGFYLGGFIGVFAAALTFFWRKARQ